MYITNFFSVILTLGIAFIKGEELINPVAEAILNGNFIITLIYAAVVAPIFEELIFRKLLLDKLRRFGDLPAILMTGIAFGLFHMNLSQFFYAAVLGFIFAYVVIRTNTVIYSILLHMMINFIATVMTPFATEENLIAIAIIFLWMIISITIGVVLFILNVKKIKLEKAAPLMKKSDYFFNVGTILYTLICFVVIVIYTIG
jgi:membrane protease YdiL (CAAX protease family)